MSTANIYSVHLLKEEQDTHFHQGGLGPVEEFGNSVKQGTGWLLLSQGGCSWLREQGEWHLTQTHHQGRILGRDCLGTFCERNDE